ncbi:MAG: hypothetical protein ACOYU7_06650 [Bacillota bacterium]
MVFNIWDRRAIKAAQRRVDELRAAHPFASPAELADKLIQRKARAAAVAGSITALPAAVPGIGTLIAVLAGTFADLTVFGHLLKTLVYELAVVYGRNPDSQDVQREIRWVFAVAAGMEAAGKHVAGAAARGMGYMASSATQRSLLALGFRAGQRTLLFRLLPWIGVALVGGMNYLFARSVGRKMCACFGETKGDAGWSGRTIDAEFTVER